MKELEEIRKCGMKNFRNIQVDEANLLTWQGLIVPDNPPYDKGAFRIEINFPAEYPFKPPKITFKTKIYHPNIDEKGQVCLPVISAENWKPATKTDQGKTCFCVFISSCSSGSCSGTGAPQRLLMPCRQSPEKSYLYQFQHTQKCSRGPTSPVGMAGLS